MDNSDKRVLKQVNGDNGSSKKNDPGMFKRNRDFVAAMAALGIVIVLIGAAAGAAVRVYSWIAP